MSSERRAVFLDRDGVLIASLIRGNKPYSASSPQDVRVISGVPEACAELTLLGYLLVMVTNQPDISRGKIRRDFVDRTNDALAMALGLSGVEVCDHDELDNCACRKPKPGLITRSAEKLGIDLTRSIVVGDRWRDIEAGRRVGCKTVFVDYGYAEIRPQAPDLIVPSLAAAVSWIRAQN